MDKKNSDRFLKKGGELPSDSLKTSTNYQFNHLPETIATRVLSSLSTESSIKNYNPNSVPIDQENQNFLKQLREFWDNLDFYADGLKDEDLDVLVIFKDLWIDYVIKATKNSELKDIDSSFIDVIHLSLKSLLNTTLNQFTLEDAQKKEFLEQCRKTYPQAALGIDHKIDSKKFIPTTKAHFLESFLATFLMQAKDDFLENIASNYTGGELFVVCLKYANKKSRDFLKEYEKFLFNQLMLLFEADHSKKLSKKNLQDVSQKKLAAQVKNNSATIATSLDISPKNKLSEVQKELLNTLMLSFPWLDSKIKKSIKSYVMRVIKNNWELNKESFLQQYQLTEIPPQALDLLEKLWIEVLDTRDEKIEDLPVGEEVQEKQSFPLWSKAEWEAEAFISVNRESLSSDELLALSKEDVALVPKDFLLSITDNQLLLELLLNLIESKYRFKNKNQTRKQIEKYFLENNNRNLFVETILRDNFDKPLAKYVGAYALDVGLKMRFLLIKDEQGFQIDGLYSHHGYEKRLKEKKR